VSGRKGEKEKRRKGEREKGRKGKRERKCNERDEPRNY
jgi:hypothetical protein